MIPSERRHVAEPKPSATRAGLWLESPLWDSFWMLSGLWLLLFLQAAQVAHLVPLVQDMLTLAALSLLWGGHILAPVIVSWMNPGLRDHMVKQQGKYIFFPISLLIGSIVLGMLGDLSQWAFVPEEIRVHINPRFLIFYTFVVWNTWHFSAQHFGVLAVYRKLAGQFSKRDRQLDRAFSVVMTCVLMPVAWYTQRREDRLGQVLHYLPDTLAMPNLVTLVIMISAGLTLLYITIEFLKPNSSLPRVLYILSIGIQPIFGTVSYPIFHLAVFSICHWMIEFALASRILQNQLWPSKEQALLSSHKTSRYSFAKQVLILAAISIPMYGVLLSPTVLGVVARFHDSLYNEAVYFSYSLGALPVSLGALSGAYFGISFVHFVYDRYLYAFSRPEVSRLIAPHLFRRIRR